MTERLSSADRRAQVVQAALSLLADTPLDRLTTRQIAAQVGVSQPALFRHFDSRDALIAAMLEQVRSNLGAIAARLLAAELGPLNRIDQLVLAVLAYAQGNPGLPRLLFEDTAGATGGAVRAPLSHIVSLQRTLMAHLVGQAKVEECLPDGVDEPMAARLLLALVQGLVLQWQLEGRPDRLQEDGRAAMALWRLAVVAGLPSPAAAGREVAAPAAEAAPPCVPELGLVELDARPILASGRDPLDTIVAALATVRDDGLLVLLAPFRPAPLLQLLSGQGCTCVAEQHDCTWVVVVQKPAAAPPLWLADLAAPEPLEQVLLHSAGLAPGSALSARLPQLPRLLLPRLDERGLSWQAVTLPDGSALLHVQRPR